MSLAEVLLVIGTFGICTGVWVTMKVIINHVNAKMCDCVSVATITKSKNKKEKN